MAQSAQEWELFINANGARDPVRLHDAAIRPDELGLSEDRPPIETLLATPIFHQDERVGSFFLVDKQGAPEFAEEDERVAAMFAAQAASIISNSRTYQAALQDRADLEAVMDKFPVALGVFDARAGEPSFMNQEARRMLGLLANTEEEVENLFLTARFMRPDGREIHFAELPGTRALQSGETVICEDIVIQLPDGTSITTLGKLRSLILGVGRNIVGADSDAGHHVSGEPGNQTGRIPGNGK